jgi:hypothetical protein
MGPLTRPLVLVGLLAAVAAGDLAAQGITTAALYGVIRGPDSGGIGDAVVTVTTLAGGERWRTTTRADGRYAFEYLSVGGPYTIEAPRLSVTQTSAPASTKRRAAMRSVFTTSKSQVLANSSILGPLVSPMDPAHQRPPSTVSPLHDY